MSQHVTDFVEGRDDWTHRWEGSDGDWEVGSFSAPSVLEDFITSRPLLLHTNTSTSGQRGLSWDDAGSVDDAEILMLCYAPSVGTSLRMRGLLRGAGTGSGGSAYFGEITGFGSYDRSLWKADGGTFSNLDNDGGTGFLSANTLYWIRVQVSGTTVRAKMWANGSAEPGSWLFSETDASLSSGWIGLSSRTAARYLHFSVGTESDLALVQPTAPGAVRFDVTEALVGSTVNLSWSLAAHANNAGLQYEGEYRLDGGAWTSLFGLQAGATYAWDTTGLESGRYEVRVRAHDGSGYGGWGAVTLEAYIYAAGDEYDQDFGSKESDAFPDDWTQFGAGAGWIEVQDTAQAGNTGGKWVATQGTSLDADLVRIISPDVITAFDNGVVRTRFYNTSGGSDGPGGRPQAAVCMRLGDISTEEVTYAVTWYAGDGFVNVARVVDGVFTNLESFELGQTDTDWWILEAEILGSTIRGRAYVDGEAVPDWQVEHTAVEDDILANGRVGLGRADFTYTRPFDTFAAEPDTTPRPARPTLTATADGLLVALEGSDYSHPSELDHAASQWQASTSENFDTTAADETDAYPDDGAPITPGRDVGPLSATTSYYFRVRYQDSAGNWSPWSVGVEETTGAGTALNTPSVTATPSYDSVDLVGSALSDPEDPDRTLVMAEWQVDEAGGGYSTPVAESLEDLVDLLSITLFGLTPSTNYIARYRQRVDDGTWSSWSSDESFATIAEPTVPDTPTASLQSKTSRSITVEGTAFSYPSEPGETHAQTRVQVSTSATFDVVGFYETFSPGQIEDLLVEGLSPNTLYYYRIRYLASNGLWSNWSAAQSTTTPDVVFEPDEFFQPVSPRHGAVVRGAAVELAWTPESASGVAFDVDVAPSTGDEESFVWTSIVADAASSPQTWDTTVLDDGAYVVRMRAKDGSEETEWEYRTVIVDNAESTILYNANSDEEQLDEEFDPMWNTDGHTWDHQAEKWVINEGSNLSSTGWGALAYLPPAQPFDADVICEVLAASQGGNFPWAWFAEQSWAGVGLGLKDHAGNPDGTGLGIWATFYMLPIQAIGDCYHAGRGDGFLEILVRDDEENPFDNAVSEVIPLGKIHTLNHFGDCRKTPRYGVRLRVTTVEDHGDGTRTARIQVSVQGMGIDSVAVGPWHYDAEHRINNLCGEACYVSREITTSRAYRSFTNITVAPTAYSTCEVSSEWEALFAVSDLVERAWAFVLDGHIFYVLNFKDRPALVHDVTTGQWHSWFTRTFDPSDITDGEGIWNMFRGIVWKGRVIAADLRDPIVWELDPHSMLDEEADVIRRAVTAFQPLRGSASARQGSLRLTARKEALGESATIRMRFSDDGGKSWSNWYSVTLTGNSYSKRIEWRSLGRIRAPGRIWEIEDAGGLVRIEGTDADLERG